ncbi:hypothetical protein CEE69_13965 [Rhodopirellula bahusiensis]|uniref:Uncharacterized protein n=1 Tax=Rhodopirellula bahusiensis TaxID=2014065 RepID=A0A2G1W7S8_9BACT|nr:hypothetical protein CEE69_13965 [Rhodopirellula bahusiensis]
MLNGSDCANRRNGIKFPDRVTPDAGTWSIDARPGFDPKVSAGSFPSATHFALSIVDRTDA